MVGNHAHGNVNLLLFVLAFTIQSGRRCEAIFLSTDCFYLLDDWLEDIRVIVTVLVLQHANKALEAHARINDVHRKRFKTAVCLAVVLHENDIPDFNHLRIIFVDEFTARHFSLFLRCARVYMDLCTGTTWPRISHFPEIIMLVSIDDMVSRDMLCPVRCSLIVTFKSFFR